MDWPREWCGFWLRGGEVDNGLCCGDGGCDRIVVGVLVLGMGKILAV